MSSKVVANFVQGSINATKGKLNLTYLGLFINNNLLIGDTL